MHDQKLTKCPRCGAPFELGFSAKACGLSFIPASQFRSFAFVDEDLNNRTWLQKLFFSPAHYCHRNEGMAELDAPLALPCSSFRL